MTCRPSVICDTIFVMPRTYPAALLVLFLAACGTQSDSSALGLSRFPHHPVVGKCRGGSWAVCGQCQGSHARGGIARTAPDTRRRHHALRDASGYAERRVSGDAPHGSVTEMLGSIVVDGFAGATTYADGSIWSEAPEAWPRATGRLIGSTATEVGELDLDAHTFTLLGVPNTYGENRRPGPTYQAGVWIVAHNMGLPYRWRLYPTPVLMDSFPEAKVFRQVMLLGPGQWWFATHHELHTTSGFSLQAEEPQGGVTSPRHDRATEIVRHVYNGSGVPVFSVPEGEFAWSAPLGASDAVAFSADGDILLVGGQAEDAPTIEPFRLVAFRATDGVVLRDTTLSEQIDHAVFDDVRPFIYVSVRVGSRPAIVVLDRDSFRRVARLVCRPRCRPTPFAAVSGAWRPVRPPSACTSSPTTGCRWRTSSACPEDRTVPGSHGQAAPGPHLLGTSLAVYTCGLIFPVNALGRMACLT